MTCIKLIRWIPELISITFIKPVLHFLSTIIYCSWLAFGLCCCNAVINSNCSKHQLQNMELYLFSFKKKGMGFIHYLPPILRMVPRRRATIAAVVAGLAIVATPGWGAVIAPVTVIPSECKRLAVSNYRPESKQQY